MSETADVTSGDRSKPVSPQKRHGPRQPLPDHEFPVWFMRTSIQRLRRAAELLILGPQYKRLARFSYDMRTCSRSSLGSVQALQLCLKPLSKSRLGQLWASAPNQIQQGSSLADSLRPAEKFLPAFYLPVVEAGEESGRLDEAFGFLERHCNLLAGPAAAIRNLWLYPVCIMLTGSFISVALNLVMGSFVGAASMLVSELASWIQLAVVVAIVALTPLRQLFDQAKLAIPWIGEFEREISVQRFFRVMALLYGVSGPRVDAMIRTAARTVTNHAARVDLLRAADAIANQATIAEAFHVVTLLSDDERSAIDVGEISGTLEESFDHIADQAESSLMAKVAFLLPLLSRLVMGAVIFSIISTILRLIM